jgi:hypothetical protein
MMPKRIPAAAIVLLLCFQLPAPGAILDQEFDPAYSSFIWLGQDRPYAAQTVTPSITGNLTQVDLNLQRNSTYQGEWTISVQRTTASGVPNGDVIATVTLAATEVPQYPNASQFAVLSVFFSELPAVQVGKPFAIVVNPSPPVSEPTGKGYWWGTSGGGYSGGATYTGVSLSSWTWLASGSDRGFKTYVEPLVPEPSSAISILAIPLFRILPRRPRVRAA